MLAHVSFLEYSMQFFIFCLAQDKIFTELCIKCILFVLVDIHKQYYGFSTAVLLYSLPLNAVYGSNHILFTSGRRRHLLCNNLRDSRQNVVVFGIDEDERK